MDTEQSGICNSRAAIEAARRQSLFASFSSEKEEFFLTFVRPEVRAADPR
jgi:hypothetical protein